MNFRYDINGLRAIAVIAVVLFHFNPAWVPGGFAGVDVFFVISGFLMTGIIFRGLENDNFNLFKFYVARANRIIPALTVLCLVLLVLGWFYLTPLDYRLLGKHVASSMGFLSNVIFWRESGYFDAASHEKWLLHTWSLSVEWQFYIIYPVVLLLLKKFLSLENLKRLIVVGTVLGFVLSVIATMKWPNLAYYLLPTRAWEMMMGGVAFLYPWKASEKKKKAIEVLGLTLIFVSYAFVSSDIPWPGHFALVPVLGAYLVIVANQQSSFITNNPLFQRLGKWSYSIYLWHWPIVVLGYQFEIHDWLLKGVIISLLLGSISYHLIEMHKFKTYKKWLNLLKVKPVWMSVLLGAISSFVFSQSGFENRDRVIELKNFHINERTFEKIDPKLVKIKKDECRLYERDGIEHGYGCNKLDVFPKDIRAVIIGDSHANSMASGVLSSLQRHDKKGVIINASSSGCIPLIGIKHRKGAIFSGCSDYNEYLYNNLTQGEYAKIPLILINRLNLYPFGFIENGEVDKPFVYFDGFESFSESFLNEYEKRVVNGFCKLSKGRDMYVVKPVPEFRFNVSNKYASQELFYGHIKPKAMDHREYNKRNEFTSHILNKLKSECGIKVLDPLPYLDSDDGYVSQVDGQSIYNDGSHLNIKGSFIVSPMFDVVWSS